MVAGQADRRSPLTQLQHWATTHPERRAYVFLGERGQEQSTISFAQLDMRATRMAAYLRAHLAKGERAALCMPTGIDFVVAFLGCLRAGIIAVPMALPRAKRSLRTAHGILADSGARTVLSSGSAADSMRIALSTMTGGPVAEVISVDELVLGEIADGELDSPPRADDVALLQYTSGSTSAPKGVVVTHGNLAANEEMVRIAFGHDESSTFVGWTPLFHDQGLIGNMLQPLYIGATCVLMSPQTFVRRPLIWLETISKYQAHTSGGPNFAFDICARQAHLLAEGSLDLSSWRVAYDGAEPIRVDTLERFTSAFERHGFRPDALYACYGLAESTLFVTGWTKGAGAHVGHFSKAALERGLAAPPPSQGDVRRLVSCGFPHAGAGIAIVDPITGRRRAPSEIGEIWVSGPAVARGYWNNPKATADAFGARLGADPNPYLRTGDLGVFFPNDGLFITGRVKDVIIIHGRNHYPHDIEQTVQLVDDALRPDSGAAFAFEDDEEAERLCVVQEVDRSAGSRLDETDIKSRIVRAISEEHDVSRPIVCLIKAGTLPKTSSGKVQRGVVRQMFLNGQLELWSASSPDVPYAKRSREAAG